MNSVGIYARLSVEDMDKHGNVDSRSIINQQELLIDYCERQGWENYTLYVDDGITGMERERPEFQRMLKDCEAGLIDIVLCKDQSRFARDDVIIKEYLHTKFVMWGVRFIGLSDNVDSESPDFMDNSSLRGFFNEWYVRDISKKENAANDIMRKQGKYYRSAPYGYMKDPNDKYHLVPDPNTKNIVIRIFESYVGGMSLRKIAEMLNAEGIPSPTAYKTTLYPNYNSRYKDNVWSSDGLRTMLSREVYIGNTVQGRSKKVSYRSKKKVTIPKEKWVRVEGTHEPLISKDLWEQARTRYSQNARASRETQEIQPLSGKVICGYCGKPMSRHVGSYVRKCDGKRIHVGFYRCPDITKGKGTCINSRCINFKALKPAVLEAINNAIKAYCDIDSIKLDEMQQENAAKVEKQYKQLNDKMSTVQKRLDSLYRDKLDGIITASEYLHYKEQFSEELYELETKLAEIKEKLDNDNQHRRDSEYRSELIKKYSEVTELTRQLTEEFIDTVVVGVADENGEREVTINLKI